jgi:Holliday junction resolvase RusA-like endonuclease
MSERSLMMFVPGIPKPAGSKRPFLIRNKAGVPVFRNGRPVMVVVDTSGKPGKDWRGDVRAVAAQEWGDRAPLTGHVSVAMTFWFARPKSHFGTGKNAAVLKPTAPAVREHNQTPDALKLARSVEDALTGMLWKDDNQLDGWQGKRWCTDPDDRPGMQFSMEW